MIPTHLTSNRRARAFTLIELLVVVAIIALLLSILLPSLTAAREQGKRAKCLANLKNLGNATHTYAVEDKSEFLFPMHDLWPTFATSPPRPWQFLAVNWFTYGGKSSTKPFDASGVSAQAAARGYGPDGKWWLSLEDPARYGFTDVRWDDMTRAYDASRRPLNKVVLPGGVNGPDARKLDWYKCPSDFGFPNAQGIDDLPTAGFNTAVYDQLGNSYRASLISLSTAARTWQFTVGPAGRRSSGIPVPGKVVLMGDAQFFNMIGTNANPPEFGSTRPEPVLSGWHRKTMHDNLLYCDGSARLTRASNRREAVLGTRAPIDWGIDSDYERMIRRGASWQLDCYPSPGVFLYGTENLASTPEKARLWPHSAGRRGS